MPISRTRHKHGHQHHPRVQPKGGHSAPAAPKPRQRRSAVTMMVILIAIFGTGIAFLSAGSEITWLLAGALLGAIAGYFIGQGMDKAAAKAK